MLRELTIFHQVLQLYGVDPPLIAQAFRQVLLTDRNPEFTQQPSNLNIISGVLLYLRVRVKQPTAAQRNVPLVQRHSNPLQYFSLGAMGA